MDSHEREKHPRASRLEDLTTEELLERLRETNQQPPIPGKQTLKEYIDEKIQTEDRSDISGHNPRCDGGERSD